MTSNLYKHKAATYNTPWGKLRIKARVNPISEEDLISAIQDVIDNKRTLTQAANDLQIAHATLSTWVHKLGIKRKKRKTPDFIDEILGHEKLLQLAEQYDIYYALRWWCGAGPDISLSAYAPPVREPARLTSHKTPKHTRY